MKGELSLNGLLVTGYVQGREEELWLELLADGEPIAITLADLRHPKGLGFILPFPPTLLEEGCTLRVRKANSSEYLGEALVLPKKISEDEAPSQNKSLLQGELLLDRGLTLSGWVIKSTDPSATVYLVAKEDGKVLACTSAKDRRYRPKTSDGHGFLLQLPTNLADGTVHLIDIEDNEGHTHPQSPIKVCLTPENLSQWLLQKNTLNKAEKDFLGYIVKCLEVHNPGASLDPNFWLEAFPAAKCPKEKSSLAVLLADPLDASVTRLSAKAARALLPRSHGFAGEIVQEDSDYLLLLQKGEKIHPQALGLMISAQKASGKPLVYADGRDLEKSEKLFLKPAFDREFFMGFDYLGPMLVRSTFMAQIPEQPDYPSLRAALVFAAEKESGICHLPEILSFERAPQSGPLRQKALAKLLTAEDSRIVVEAGTKEGLLRVRYPLEAKAADAPLVSIIIPTRDHAELLSRCLDSLEQTSWPKREILIIDNGSQEEDALELLKKAAKKDDIRVLPYPGIFNYAAINNFAVEKAEGEILCFLNNDTEILDPHWLSEMLALLLAEGRRIGCVGAKLLWPNDLVQHAGVVVGPHQLACHIGNLWLAEEDGYLYTNQLTREVSCVTAACLLTKKELFTRLNGFDAQRFPVAFNDVDFCLRVRQEGLRILWTPYACLRHHESASRGRDTQTMNKARAQREIQYFRTLWGDYEDPFYNPNLPLSTVTEPYCGYALPPRNRHCR